MENPYRSPETSSQIEKDLDTSVRESVGIRRLPFAGALFGMCFLLIVFNVGVAFLLSTLISLKAEWAFFAMLLLFPIHARLKNIGSNPTWCFLVFIPLLNLLLLARCLICPEGYAETKKLDTAGKVMTGLTVVFLLLLTLGIAAALFAAPVSHSTYKG